jgi:enolase-phosphatase E1
MTRAILTDIEGTTSSIAFVADVLFPYARRHLPGFVAAHPEQCAPILAEVAAIEPGDPVTTLLRWIDEDRKITPLKTLQGLIWDGGFASGELVGHFYPDAVAALRRWQAAGLKLYVYSSGSVHAQKLLFGHSDHGDLTPIISGWFDTTSGAKRDADSYRRIASAIRQLPGDILFLSDVAAETAAATAAGLQVRLIARDGGPGDITSFDALLP